MTATKRAAEPFTIVNRRDERMGGWYATVEMNGKRYQIGVARGKAVRIPYKPRGSNTGFHWHGSVFEQGVRGALWQGRVSKSVGVRWLLEAAGVVALRPSELKKVLHRLNFSMDMLRSDIGRIVRRILLEEQPIKRRFLVQDVRRELDTKWTTLAELEAEYVDLIRRNAPDQPAEVPVKRCGSWPDGGDMARRCTQPHGHALDCTDGAETWPTPGWW